MAEEKKQSLFRKKSQEYIDSPEKLDNYLHVTSPGVWVLLATIIVLLIGVVVWGILGRLETQTSVAIVSAEDQTVCYIPESAIDSVVRNPKAFLNGEELNLEPDSLEPIAITDSTNVYLRLAGNFEVGDIVYEVNVSEPIEEGIYSGRVMTETISPISLLFN